MTIFAIIFLMIVSSVGYALMVTKSVEESPRSISEEEHYLANLNQEVPGSIDSIQKHANLNDSEANTSAPLPDGDSSQLVIGLNSMYPGDYNSLVEKVSKFGGNILHNVSIRGEPIALVANLPKTSVSVFERETQTTGLARYVEPRIRFNVDFVPNDPYYVNQWAMPKIEADWAWNTTRGNSSVVVAIIDTGIDYNHPDLASNYVPGGYDWVNDDNDPIDDNGHGTHVAGIIAAVLNNSQGIAGLAQVTIMAEKAFDLNGTGYEDNIANAIYDAVGEGANILSNSWSSNEDSTLIHEAMQYAYNNYVLIVAAAGNDASTTKMYPAAYKEVIGVTATDRFDNPAWFTSYGDWVELAAPGVHIYSTMPTYHVTLNDKGVTMNYGYLDGTSMACPHVASLAALVWSQFPNATRDWVRARLRYSADDLGAPGFDEYYGYGRINARRAVESPEQLHDLGIFGWERPQYIQPGDTVVFNVTVLNLGMSTEQNVEVELLVDNSVTDSSQILQLQAGVTGKVSLFWYPSAEGHYNVTVYVLPVAGETVTSNNVMMRSISVLKRLSLSPAEDAVGAKVIAIGAEFPPQSEVLLSFNDVPLGYAIVDYLGDFTFTFNVPLSKAGEQTVKVLDAEGNYVTSNFTVIDETPLDIKIDVGTTYYVGQTAVFYAQTVYGGQPVNSTIVSAVLHEPDGSAENLTLQQVATGLYMAQYSTENSTGTYALVIEADYVTDIIQASGTSFKCFLVSDTLSLMNRQVAEIKDGIATVLTDLGSVKLNLTAINATLENIFLNITAINETTATIETTIGMMDGKITSIDGNVATILVPGLGQIKADVSKLKEAREAWTLPQYVILSVAIIAAVAALSTVAILKRRKVTATRGNSQASSESIQ